MSKISRGDIVHSRIWVVDISPLLGTSRQEKKSYDMLRVTRRLEKTISARNVPTYTQVCQTSVRVCACTVRHCCGFWRVGKGVHYCVTINYIEVRNGLCASDEMKRKPFFKNCAKKGLFKRKAVSDARSSYF